MHEFVGLSLANRDQMNAWFQLVPALVRIHVTAIFAATCLVGDPQHIV